MIVNKTQARVISPRALTHSPDTIVDCDSQPLDHETVSFYKNLGVLGRKPRLGHILHLTKKVSRKIGALARARQQLTIAV